MKPAAQRLEAAQLPGTPRLLLEAVAEALELGSGETRLEAVFAEGRLRYVYAHTRHVDGQLDERGSP